MKIGRYHYSKYERGIRIRLVCSDGSQITSYPYLKRRKWLYPYAIYQAIEEICKLERGHYAGD